MLRTLHRQAFRITNTCLDLANSGNDAYINVMEANAQNVQQPLKKPSKPHFALIYFIQHDLGFKHLGIADDEFPNKRGLALILITAESSVQKH